MFNIKELKKRATEIFPELDHIIQRVEVQLTWKPTLPYADESLVKIYIPEDMLDDEENLLCFFLREILKINSYSVIYDVYNVVAKINYKYQKMVIQRYYELGLYPPRFFIQFTKQLEKEINSPSMEEIFEEIYRKLQTEGGDE
jgi:hypothetical protein